MFSKILGVIVLVFHLGPLCALWSRYFNILVQAYYSFVDLTCRLPPLLYIFSNTWYTNPCNHEACEVIVFFILTHLKEKRIPNSFTILFIALHIMFTLNFVICEALGLLINVIIYYLRLYIIIYRYIYALNAWHSMRIITGLSN